jgi:hypothetical protein
MFCQVEILGLLGFTARRKGEERRRPITHFPSFSLASLFNRFTVEVTRVSFNPEVGDGQESAENPPLFFIKPTDAQGQGIAGKERLEDQGI